MSPRSRANTELTNLAESAGKEFLATRPPTPQAARRGHVPKAQGLERRGRGPWPCNREGARGGWQTDRLSAHYSKIAAVNQILSAFSKCLFVIDQIEQMVITYDLRLHKVFIFGVHICESLIGCGLLVHRNVVKLWCKAKSCFSMFCILFLKLV